MASGEGRLCFSRSCSRMSKMTKNPATTPIPVQPLQAGVHRLGHRNMSHRHACLQCRWLQGFAHQPFHQGVKRCRLQRLAHRLSVTIAMLARRSVDWCRYCFTAPRPNYRPAGRTAKPGQRVVASHGSSVRSQLRLTRFAPAKVGHSLAYRRRHRSDY